MTADSPFLQRLVESGLSLADGQPDLRDRRVVDSEGEDLGSVTGLFVDASERRVRFLQVKGGGILGFGDTETLVPVEAVDAFDDETVRLGHDKKRVTGAPAYDPKLVKDVDYWDGLYAWYGYSPFWSPGFGTYPIGLPPTRRDLERDAEPTDPTRAPDQRR